MGRDTFATATDLQALTYYSDRQRVDVLACYLLDPRQFSMQEVAELVLGDGGSQAGQRVSLITRCYGFAARNAGRYARTADRKDIQDFVRKYHPERCGGLPEGTFDDFLRPRLEARQRRQQAESERQQKLQNREEQRRMEEARRQQQLRQMEEQQRQAELQRQREMQRQLAEQQRQREEYLRQQQVKKQQAQQIAEQAAGWWRKPEVTVQDVMNGIQAYQKAMAFSWEEYCADIDAVAWVRFSPSSEYFNVCANAAEAAFRVKDYAAALTFCRYLCDYRPGNPDEEMKNRLFLLGLDKDPNRGAFGRGYRVRAQIYLDPNSGYYNEQNGAEAARIGGTICGDPTCLLRYAECLEFGRGVKRDLWAASSAYSKLKQVSQFQAQASAKENEIGKKLFRASAAEVAGCLEKIAPDAFPMVGHETKDWNAYRQTVLNLPALWEGYQKEHSDVMETGLLFKKKHYMYRGRLSEEQFRQCCEFIWSQRRRQYEMAAYKPCPGEAALTDQFFQKGMEQFRNQQFAEAVSSLKLPATCGYLQARKALVEIYGTHIRKPEVLRRMLEVLASSEDLSACEDLAKGYASLGDWENALNWTEKAGELPGAAGWRDAIRSQAVSFACGIDEDADVNALTTALRILQRLEIEGEKLSRLLWLLANRQTDEEQKTAYLKMAAERSYQPACYALACLEISRDGDLENIISLLETVDAGDGLPNRELLAEQYLKKQDFTRAVEIYVQLEEVQNVYRCMFACHKARAQMPLNYSERTEEQHRLAYKIYHTILKYGIGLEEKANAQYSLYVAYKNGYGTERDTGKSVNMLKASAAGGCEPACYIMAQFYMSKGKYEAAQEEMQKCTSDKPEYRKLREEIARKLEERREEACRIAAAALKELYGRLEPGAPEAAAPETPASESAAPEIPVPESTSPETPAPEAGSQPAGSRKGAKQVHLLVIDEELYGVSNATEAVTLTFSELLNEYPERLEDCLRNISQLTRDSSKCSSVFRQKKLISTPAGDIWLGVSTGFEVKCAMTDRLCQVLELPAKKVIWYDGLEAVYMNSERG